MELSELPAAELAKIDAICLQYEEQLRRGASPSIETFVSSWGGAHQQLLRRELEAVRQELDSTPAAASPSDITLDGTNLDTVKPRPEVELPTEGSVIGPYQIGSQLGRGGMGVVFRAVDSRLNRDVAIKLLAVGPSRRAELTERFEREAKAVAALSHPNIVALYDIGVHAGLPYAVMEYLDGELLDRRFQRRRMSATEVRQHGAQIADALEVAHSGGVIHRDLKPHNIMLVSRRGGDSSVTSSHSVRDSGSTRDGSETNVVKLFDFGLSRVPRDGWGDALETGEGIVLGTPGYMAPEQARAESVTEAADIFSLGCVLFEAFYGRRTFDGETMAARFKATIEQDPQPDPMRRRDDVPLADLITHCLQKEATARPTSAAEIARRLREGMLTPGQATSERGHIERRRFIGWAAGAAALGGLAAAGYFAISQRDGLTQIRSLAVLSFADEPGAAVHDDVRAPSQPIGDRDLHPGERLAALLVHEMTRLSELTVPRYRPLRAETPADFRRIGAELEVDALLTGSIRQVDDTASPFMVVDVQLISSETGAQLWGKSIETDSGDNFLNQSKLATEIASTLGHRLTSTADEAAPPSVETFHCLVDGKTRSDPESIAGLERALRCFEHAHEVDRRFVDPLAGIALTAITLAAQSPPEKSLELIRKAREAVTETLTLDPASIDGRLAGAMLDWQTTNRYERAERTLHELSMVASNNWQVLHQYGLLKIATGRYGDAATLLREASQLNPWSVLLKVDRARASWFAGKAERAIDEAARIRDKYDRNPLARGLLVDIFESQQRFDDAAAEQDDFKASPTLGESAYYARRAELLSELPYGPYGPALNDAIMRSRGGNAFGVEDLAELADSTPPMLPLLLAAHPAFTTLRQLPRAEEILPLPNRQTRGSGNRSTGHAGSSLGLTARNRQFWERDK